MRNQRVPGIGLALAVAAAGVAGVVAAPAARAGTGYSITISQFAGSGWDPYVLAGGRYPSTVTVTAAAAATVHIQVGALMNPNPAGVTTSLVSGPCGAGAEPYVFTCSVPRGTSTITLATSVAGGVPDLSRFSLNAILVPPAGAVVNDTASATVLRDVGGASSVSAISGPTTVRAGQTIDFVADVHAPVDGEADWDFPGGGSWLQVTHVSATNLLRGCDISGSETGVHSFGCEVAAGDGQIEVTAQIAAGASITPFLVTASYFPRHIGGGRQPANVVKFLDLNHGGGTPGGASGGSTGAPAATGAKTTAPQTGTAGTAGAAGSATATGAATQVSASAVTTVQATGTASEQDSASAPTSPQTVETLGSVQKTASSSGSGSTGVLVGVLIACLAAVAGGAWLLRARGRRASLPGDAGD